MEKDERAKYKKRIKTYKKLGAEEFQEVVFTVERLKFKVLKKIIPDFLEKYDKYCDRTKEKALKKAKTEEQRKTINRVTAMYKMDARIEYNQEKNRNYHMNSNRPMEIYEYLKWNKSVHVRGMITDTILIIATSIGIVTGLPLGFLIPALLVELVSLGINFECVNIQNYNMCRYKLVEESIIKRYQKKVDREIEEYGDIAEKVHTKIEETGKIPSITEMIENSTPEQIRKMKEIINAEIRKREEEKIKEKTLLRGNK